MSFVSYSARGLDAVAYRIIGGGGRISFLEVAPRHLIDGSATYALYLRGARGTIVGEDPALCRKVAEKRSGDQGYCLPAQAGVSWFASVSAWIGERASELGGLSLATVSAAGIGEVLEVLPALEAIAPRVIAVETLTLTPPGQAAAALNRDGGWRYLPFDGESHLLIRGDIDFDESWRLVPGPADDLLPASELQALLNEGRMRAEVNEARLPIEVKQILPFSPLNREREAEIARLEGRIRDLEDQIADLKQSTSWRVTAPLRAASENVRRRTSGGEGRG